jgi:hypothetical protein
MKYKLEGDISFYDTLLKSLDEDTDDDELMCKISGIPLEEKAVTLECNHKFNYEPLYKEICRQKFDFKTYDIYLLSKKEQLKMRELKVDYFIKCPYCRSVQFNILPYYEELGLDKIYGINTLDETFGMKKQYINTNILYGSDDYTIYYYGKPFKKGICCENENNFVCKSKYVACIPNTELSYCTFHYRSGLKKYKLKQKQQKKEEKNKLKEDNLKARQKLFEEKNLQRAEKGLPPLKSLPRLKPVVENIVTPGLPIGQYVPEDEQNEVKGCKQILKTGPNKGKICGCKKIYKDDVCKRHSSSVQQT